MIKNKKKKYTKAIEATKTVYSYYFPEVRKEITSIARRYPHHVFLRSVGPGLDDLHIPVMEKYCRVFADELVGIWCFQHRYVVSGGSEAIFHFLVRLKVKESQLPIYVLHGEYQGYSEYARSIGITVKEVSEKDVTGGNLPRGLFFLSNPSARDGMILNSDLFRSILRCHRVILDATYVGLTKPFAMDVRHKNIVAVIVSLSKPYGLYYYRVGFVFSRVPVASLEGNKWFKNVFSLIIADRLLSRIKRDSLWKKYIPIQRKIVGVLRKRFGVPIEPADVFILGNMRLEAMRGVSPGVRRSFRKYRRGDSYRLCLTPYFLFHEKHKTF